MPSSPNTISRGPITDRLLEQLATEGFPVGDNAEPRVPFGWQGEPNAPGMTFTPWLSLSPAGSVPQSPAGPLANTYADWKLAYSVFYTGLSRKQAEALADRMRHNLSYIERELVDTPTGAWKFQKVACTTIGNTNRISSAYPDYFTQADSFEVWVSKGS
jgi:hypothetical protein